MKTFIQTVILILTLSTAFNASAETIQCESENVKISGQIQNHYLRKGHSVFSGNLNLQIYDHQKIISVSTITVFRGDIQDDTSIQSTATQDQNGQPVRINLTQDESSFLQIGSSTLHLKPNCQITPDTPTAQHCLPGTSIGLTCQIIQGQCICHQHNQH